MLQDHPTAIYFSVYIYTHIQSMPRKLNLVLVEACKVNQRATGFHLHALEGLLTFFPPTAWHTPCLPRGPEDA